jgi:DNA-binding NtrC family response regulator
MAQLSSAFYPFALVVEGDAAMRLDAVRILEDAGFRVLDVATADQAIQLLRQHGREFTLLMTCVGMIGEEDGFGLARKAAVDYPDICIVVASGHHTLAPGDLPESASFIAKPFCAEVVRNHLRRIMANNRERGS